MISPVPKLLSCNAKSPAITRASLTLPVEATIEPTSMIDPVLNITPFGSKIITLPLAINRPLMLENCPSLLTRLTARDPEFG